MHASPQILYGWRRFLLRLFGADIGRGVLIRPSVTVTYPWKLKIGDFSWIGDGVELYSLGRISIGRNVVVSQGTYLCAGTHDFRAPDFPLEVREITIEDEAWVAAQAFVTPGITIGEGAVVGARSVVTKNVPAGAIVAGHPARAIGWRSASKARPPGDHDTGRPDQVVDRSR